jgi:hypothetical protein
MLGKEDPEDVKTKERIRTERERLNLLREDIMKRLAAERANPNVFEKVRSFLWLESVITEIAPLGTPTSVGP